MANLLISYWAGPPARFLTPERFLEIAQCGMTFAISNNFDFAFDAQTLRTFVAAAQANNVPVLIDDKRIRTWDPTQLDVAGAVRDWKDASGVFGYVVADEPRLDKDPNIFLYLGEIVAELRAKDPARLTYLNLLPFGYGPYGNDEPGYTQYIERCITEVKPHILSFDYYGNESDASRDGFLRNLQIVRDVCNAHGQPFWTILCALRSCSTRLLRWQAAEALRYGTSGIIYFVYWPSSNPNADEAMVRPDGTLTQRYHEVKELNHDLQIVADRVAPALFGRVRSTHECPAGAGDLWFLNGSAPSMSGQLVAPASWSWTGLTVPGYGLVNKEFTENGFWLTARNDLLNRTFYVLNLVNGAGRLYRVTQAKVDDLGTASWDDPHRQNMLGGHFAPDGFWVSIAGSAPWLPVLLLED